MDGVWGFSGAVQIFCFHRHLVAVDTRGPWYAVLGVALEDLSDTDGKYKSGKYGRTKMNL